MDMSRTLLYLCSLTFIVVIIKAECHTGWMHYGNSCYYFSDVVLDWYRAESSCRGHDARLAEISNKGQSDFLIDTAKRIGGSGYWLGGRDDVEEGKWLWASTDLPFTYTAWGPNEPSNGGSNEDCLHMVAGYSMKWNDVNCEARYNFICEKEYPGDDGHNVIG